MNGAVVQLVVVLALGTGGMIWAMRWLLQRRLRRSAALRQAIATVDATAVVDEHTGTARCTAHGHAVRFCFVTRGSGSSSEGWTEVEVDVPLGPLVMHLRPHQFRDDVLIEKKLAVDVQLGSSAFDTTFLVEAGPAEVVRALLTITLQARLVALKPDELESKPYGLCLAKRGWNEDPESIAEFVDLAASLAAGVAPAIATALERAAPAPATAYRGEAVSGEAREKRATEREGVLERMRGEAAEIERNRARRAALRVRMATTVIAMVVGLAAVAWALTSAR